MELLPPMTIILVTLIIGLALTAAQVEGYALRQRLHNRNNRRPDRTP